MITTDVIKLAFSGDDLTKSFDVQIEGIPIAPDGASHFAVSRKDAAGEIKVLRYGVDYSYVAHIVNGFSNSLTLTLNDSLPAGESIIVLRTTPVFSISYYPENKTPPKQVEADIDNIIKILQEQGHLIKELREDLDAEIAARKEADDALASDIKAEARIREEADNALGERIDLLGDISDAQQKILDAAEVILNASGELQGSVKTIYFVSDGAATAYRIPEPILGRDILLMAFNAATRRKIYFAEKTEKDGSITLELAAPLPTGTRFGVVYLRAADDGGEGKTVADVLANYPTKEDMKSAIEDAVSSVVTKDNTDSDPIVPVSTIPQIKVHPDTITGDGSASEFIVTHDLGTRKVVAWALDASWSTVGFGVQAVSDTAVKLMAATAPAAGSTFTVIIIGVTE